MIALTYLEFYSGIGGWGHALEGACRSIAAAASQNHPQNQHAVMANGESINAKKHKISLQNDDYGDDSNTDLPPPIFRPELLAAFDHSDLANSVFVHNHIDTSRASSSETSSHPAKKKRSGRKQKGPVRQTPIERLSLSELQTYDADVWCMSPPCQPHTRQHGNQQREKDDPRSKSFLHLCHVLGEMEEEKLPALLLLENVVGFEQSGVECGEDGDGGAAATDEDEGIGSFQVWRRALFRRNYKVAHFHIDPTHVGLPNVRPRHYTVAFRPGALQRRLRQKTASNTQLQLPSPRDGSHGRLFCKEALDKPPIIHDEKSLLAAAGEPLPTVPCVGTFLDADLPPRATADANPSKLKALQIPEKVRTSSSAWCFDIVTPDHRRSACFTHSYGKFIRGTGSILYYGPQMPKEGAALDDGEARCNATIGTYPNNITDETTRGTSNNPQEDRFALAPPEERAFDASWSKDLEWDRHVRYLSGTEIARLMGFPVDAHVATTATDDAEQRRRTFGFPPGCSTKQQWKLLGNSLNVRVAATVAEIGLRSLLSEGSPKWIVRPARPEDREAVERCLAASYSQLLRGDYLPGVLSKSLPAMTTARPELLACPTWYVALHPDTGELVGCGGWTKHVPNKPEESQPHLRHFATDPKFTRSGIGRALWERTWNDVCKVLGPETRLEAFSTITALPFYESLGFREVKRMGVCFGGCQPVDFPCVLMERVP